MKTIVVSFIVSVGMLLGIWNGYSIDSNNAHYVLKMDLDNESIVASVAPQGQVWSITDHVELKWGVAGINGWYFCPKESKYASCWADNWTDNYRISDWLTASNRRWMDTGIRWVFGVLKNWQPMVINNNYGYVEWPNVKENRELFPQLKEGISNFPILLLNGKNVVSEYEWYIFPAALSVGEKTFICHDESNKYVTFWFVYNKTSQQVAEYIKKEFGCYSAIQLDNGASKSLYHSNEVQYGGRGIPDAFVVVPNNRTTNTLEPQYKPIWLMTDEGIERLAESWLTKFMLVRVKNGMITPQQVRDAIKNIKFRKYRKDLQAMIKYF